MSHYKTQPPRHRVQPLRGARPRRACSAPARSARSTARPRATILAEVDRLSREDLAASYEDSDRNPPVFDPATHTAPVPESFKKSYQAWMDAEYWRLQISEELGGTPRPPSLIWAHRRAGARRQRRRSGCTPPARRSPASSTATATSATRQIAQHHRRPPVGLPRWSSPSPTPAPTSAPAAPRPSANDDGTWNIEGVKRFITSGEHDMSENIIHLVLARPVGVEGVGGPGTKGLSLFLVPEVPLRPRDRRADRRAQRRLRHQRRAQDGHQGLQHLRGHLRRPASAAASRPRAGCSARCTTASPRCSRSSRTPG